MREGGREDAASLLQEGSGEMAEVEEGVCSLREGGKEGGKEGGREGRAGS